ncbi:MAG: mannose-1-phosphate guanylyltransferase [Tenuifilaceae bacterium]|nr:mannose-1-phosphate guanylyltransferase [Tenuifilaceae bacterium]
MSTSNVYCVIMAGGIGSRFWPLSRSSKPKQFLDILGTGSTLIQQTFNRVTRFCPPENIYVVTGSAYRETVLEQLPELTAEQVLLEPMRRNTAPCIAYANQVIEKRDPNAIIVVAPSDHLVLEPDRFVKTITTAIAFASEKQALLTIGIKPSRPETGYGYIQICKQSERAIPNLYKVKTFTEKPNLELAKVFIESGEFYWNSGVFIWSLSAINSAFDKYLPDVYGLFQGFSHKVHSVDHDNSLMHVYADCKNISIDYGILEKADNVYVICSEFGWSDLGTWGSLYQNREKDENSNAISGANVMPYDVSGSIISMPNDKLVIVQGLKDYIVAESNNILLICEKEKEQEIKKFQNDVLIEKGDKFL